MPAPKKPETFDAHVGSVVSGLARPHGGRPFLISLLPWSKATVDRRIAGVSGFTVQEMEIVARALNTTPAEIASQALRNYAGGTEQDGINKLIREEGPTSEAPVSLDDHRKRRTPAEMTEEEMEGERSAANTDPEIGLDEPDLP